MNQRPLKEVVWVGDSKERLKEFPQAAQRHIGHALGYAQHGGKHHTAKPLKGFDSGVFELAVHIIGRMTQRRRNCCFHFSTVFPHRAWERGNLH